jgi:uncharacterized protein with HEPN domain
LQDSFFRDEIRQAAVLHHLTVIGEAIHRLAPVLKQKYPDIPWQQIVSVRHRIAHAYFDLDWQILWTSAKEDVPELGVRVTEILRNEFGSEIATLEDLS